MSEKKSKKWYFIGLLVIAVLAIAVGIRSGLIKLPGTPGAPQAGGPAAVKVMQVIKKDTPLNYEFVGQVVAKNEVKIMAKVSGKIVEKMVNGGDTVVKGQPLFKIDDKQYRSAILANQAQVAQAEAAYSSANMNADRYATLVSQDAIDRKSADDAASTARQNQAAVASYQAKLQQAEEDLQDTIILSPVDGRIDVNDLSIGSFVSAGATVMANVSSIDPVWVQFSMSENEYLKFAQLGNGALPENIKNNLKLILSNGTEYPVMGHIEQIDRGINTDTGSITLKAVFANSQRLLLPGMFARISAQGEVRQGAILIPQRAVQQILGKTFVTVIGEGDTAESRPVKMGVKVGNMWLVEEGLTENDRVVVEGTNKIQPGAPVQVTMIGPDDLTTPAQQ
ncbi:MAG: efflux RND transporter periplasmic adaptor subunit [Pelosinus sp.]|nr:efflux RND transporter periplasmic adaptor subunit [Pelosinus sp.]